MRGLPEGTLPEVFRRKIAWKKSYSYELTVSMENGQCKFQKQFDDFTSTFGSTEGIVSISELCRAVRSLLTTIRKHGHVWDFNFRLAKGYGSFYMAPQDTKGPEKILNIELPQECFQMMLEHLCAVLGELGRAV